MNIIHTNRKKSGNNVLISAFFLFVMLLPSSLPAQELKENGIDIKVRNESVESVFNKLSKITNFKFFYDQEVINDIPQITLDLKNSTLTQVLNGITGQSKLYFNRVNNTITVTRRQINNNLQVPVKTVSGVVYDERQEPIIGASVRVKGADNGTITDINGSYRLLDVPENAVITISYIGYREVNLTANDRTLTKVIMREDTEMIDEVVVIGYGTVRKRDLTGAVSSLRGGDVVAAPTGNVMEALQGKVSGMDIVKKSGEIGSDVEILLRGSRSIYGGVCQKVRPLFFIAKSLYFLKRRLFYLPKNQYL